ncbi:MAG: flagellar P-ring protein precursor FlgI [Bradymonadia bacterium]
MVLAGAVLAGLVAPPRAANAVRVKDIAYVNGVRSNQLLGYGLVVGLAGTGDTGNAQFTVQSTVSMLSRMGIRVDPSSVQTRNVAAVMVTAELPPFARSGQNVDVVVSSLGNARSLQGGTLLLTPLRAADGEVYAVGQGPLTVGGYTVDGGSGTSSQSGFTNVGRVPSGAIVEQSITTSFGEGEEIRLNLHDPDFTTAVNVAREIGALFATEADAVEPTEGPSPYVGIASAVDASTIVVQIPEPFRNAVPQFVSIIERVEVETDTVARVIVNERTGTVVLGGNVRLSEVAVAHGSLSVRVDTTFTTSQPSPFGEGDTQVVPNADLQVQEEDVTLRLVGPAASIEDVISALNAVGTTPRDLIAILDAINSAGALHADLVIQ